MIKRQHTGYQQRGVAIVEFTIALPVLLLVLLATVELGRALFQYNTLHKTVRDGSRYVASRALGGSTEVVNITNQIRIEAQNLVAHGNILGTGSPLLPGLSPANVTVADQGGGYIAVSATWNYPPLLGAQMPTLGITAPVQMAIPLRSTNVMRAL